MNMIKRIDPTLILLFIGMLIFTGVLIFVEHFFASDGQVFQVISGVLTGFAGAFFARMNPKADHKEGESSLEITRVETKPQPEQK